MYIIDSIAAKSQKHEETEKSITISYLKNGSMLNAFVNVMLSPPHFWREKNDTDSSSVRSS